MTNDRPADDDEYWQRVRDADDVREPARYEESNVKTDPDEVRGWAEERDAVPVNDPNASGPGAYALRHENVVDGSAHERVTWEDFVASFRGEDMAFHHSDEDEAGTHRFVNRSDVEEYVGGDRTDADRGVTGTAEDEGRPTEGRTDDAHSGVADPDIGAAETGSGRTDTSTDRDTDVGTAVGDREGGVESGTNADAGTDPAGAETGTGRTETDARTGTGTPSDTDVLADVSEGASVVDDQGETVGIVTAVESGTIYVDPNPGLTEKLSAKLGWADQDDAEYTVDASDIAGVENGDVRLKPVTL